MKLLLLSYPFSADMPTYGKLPKPKVVPYKSIAAGDTSNIYTITLCNHVGTHVDAPAHFVSGGRRISDYSPEELTFRKPLLVDIPKGPGGWVEKEDMKNVEKLGSIDGLLIRTGFGSLRDKNVYGIHNPGISPEAIIWLRQKLPEVRCVGIDSISISGFQDRPRGRAAHLAAFEKRKNLGDPLLLIEDMNLAVLKADEKIQKVIVVPWFMLNIDSTPCTVLAEVISSE